MMKVTVKFYEKGFSGSAPEIESLQEEFEVTSRDEAIEYAKEMNLPASAEYAHIFVGKDDPIAVTNNGIRDMESGEWIVEPDEED